MLKADTAELARPAERDRLLGRLEGGLANQRERFGEDAIRLLDAPPVALDYPVLEYPTKVVSHNLDKTPEIGGTLLGLKGQYLILDSGVINLRKYTGRSEERRVGKE